MPNYIGVYLHGFLSSGNSAKGQWFKSQVERQIDQDETCVFSQFHTPTYPISSAQNSIAEIERLLKALLNEGEEVVLLGSSMGGFYAQFLGQKYHLPYILINPALNPKSVFYDNLGQHTNPATGEVVDITAKYIDGLLEYDVTKPDQSLASLLLIDEDDEVIDVDFAKRLYSKDNLTSDSKFRSIIYSGGDHSFIHIEQAWLDIQQFIENLDGELI